MKRLAFLVALLLPLITLEVAAQKTFEVASIKPSAPAGSGDGHNYQTTAGPRLGPGTTDATRWVCDNCPLSMLLAEAYGVKRFQITGPKWIDSERFDVVARVAEGATKEDLRAMQQNLLAERFKLKVRREKKEMQLYDLVIAKNQPKLKETAPVTPGSDGASAVAPTHDSGHGGPNGGSWTGGGAGGFAGHSTGRTSTMTMHGSTRHQAVGEDMQHFADFLAAQLDRPVTDSTGLTGNYDFVLTFSGSKAGDSFGGGGGGASGAHGNWSGPSGGGNHADSADSDGMSQPPLLKAIQEQLGLRLDAKKGPADILIVESVEKVPTEN